MQSFNHIFVFVLNRWLRYINEFGMCLLKNVPTDVGMAVKVIYRYLSDQFLLDFN